MGSRQILFLFFSVLFAWKAHSQTRVTDSLEQKLQSVKGKDRVDVLNELTFEFISIDNDKAMAYGQQALSLGRQLKYEDGEARAFALRGVYEYLSGQFAEAHRDLHQALALYKQTGNKQGRGYALLQLGNCSLEEVENDSALIYFRQSYQIFKDSTDPASLSKLYRNISALYGQKYQADSQQYYLEKAIRIRRLLGNKTLLANGIIMQADIRLRSGDFLGAEELVDEAEEVVKTNPADTENLNDIRHLRALILFQQGKFDQAVVLFDSARNYYFRNSLMRKYVNLLADLGEVFSDRGEYELALNNLYDGLKLAELKGFEVEKSIIRNSIGWVNFHLGDNVQALRLANETLKGVRLMPGDRANALTLRGVVLTGMRDFTNARPCLDSVLTLYKKVNNKRGMSEALLNLGYLEGLRGNYTQALAFHQESIKLAEQVAYIYGLAWSYWGIGEVYFKVGDFAKAARALDLSERYAGRTGSNEVMVLNFNTRRDLLEAQGKFKESLRYSKMASKLSDSIHRSDLARRFVNLEKMQEIEKRDHDIEVLQKDKELAQEKINLQEAKLRQQSMLIVGGIVGIVLLGALAFTYYRFYARIKQLSVAIFDKNTRIQAQADKLTEVNLELKKLYQEVSEQKEKIQAQADELAESNRSIIDMNRSLERIVAEKTVELRTTNEELVKHNSELLQFSYTVSHNLRGPVARLLGLSNMAQAESDLNQARVWLSLITKTTHDLDLIIKDLSKILELRNEPHQFREHVDLAKEWQQSWSLLQDSLDGTEEIVTNFKALPAITTVRPMLQSIFYNLLSNAIKFKSPDRSLRVIATSKLDDGRAVLEITDNGLGFNAQQHREKIFKLYKRFHTHVEGRGLGLYLIKSQIEVLHGSIEVESELDKGSLFRVILPMMEEVQAGQKQTSLQNS